ncbi:hypothetical protein [Pseudanabaena minima]|uniref:hypothetical protein n=1 Tax=Pseudanabaena minima TaxID=890415 RepID=UPI003DA927E3
MQIITLALCLLPIAGIAEAVTPVTAIAQCSTNEFKSFFEQFVHDSAGREQYISSEVQIRDYQDPSLLVMTIGDKNYMDFRIGAIGNRYVYLDPSAKFRGNDELLKKRLKLDFQKIDAKTFRVNYIRADFINDRKDRDGNLVRTYGNPEAYIFEHRDGCWYLSQSLRQYRSWKESKENKLFTKILRTSTRIKLDNGEFVYMGKDDHTFSHDLIVTAYTDLLYYKKLDAQFGYVESDRRNRWREWNILHEAVSKELMRFYSTLQCSSKELAVVPRFDDYDDSSGKYGSQSLDRIAKAIAEYHALHSDLHLSPEALKNRWLEIRKKISINPNDACSILGKIHS